MLSSSQWYLRLTCQAPETFSHSFCRNVRVTCQSIPKEGRAGTFQTTSHPCTHFQVNTVYAQRMLHRNNSRRRSPAINPSSSWKGCISVTNALLSLFASARQMCWSPDSKPPLCKQPSGTEALLENRKSPSDIQRTYRDQVDANMLLQWFPYQCRYPTSALLPYETWTQVPSYIPLTPVSDSAPSSLPDCPSTQ